MAEKAVGINEVSWEEYGRNLEKNLKQLVDRLKRKAYKPLPARRVYIPKTEKEKRPLGIPALENNVVEQGIKIATQRGKEDSKLDEKQVAGNTSPNVKR